MKATITVEVVCKGIYGKNTPRTKETITIDMNKESIPDFIKRYGTDLVERAANGLDEATVPDSPPMLVWNPYGNS